MDDKLPYISVVVPVYNEARHIEQALISLFDQNYPHDRYEVIVVDNGSVDGTRDIIKKFPTKLLDEPARSSALCRNRGISQSRGEYIAFIDGDSIADCNWLAGLVDTALSSGAGIVGGRIEFILNKKNFANMLMYVRHSQEVLKDNIIRRHAVPTGSVLIQKELFDRFGFFSPIVTGSDTEFSLRAALKGAKISYAENSIARHQCDFTNAQYLWRSFKKAWGREAGRGAARNFGYVAGVLIKVPIHPGLKKTKLVAESFNIKNPLKVFLLFLYVWTDRFFDYFGSVWGCFKLPLLRWE